MRDYMLMPIATLKIFVSARPCKIHILIRNRWLSRMGHACVPDEGLSARLRRAESRLLEVYEQVRIGPQTPQNRA